MPNAECMRQPVTKKGLLFAICCVLIAALPGCFIQSLHPFYQAGMAVSVPEATGKWYLMRVGDDDVSGKQAEPWIFEADTVLAFDDGTTSALNIGWFRVGDALFADISPSEKDYEKRINKWSSMHLVSVHSVCKVLLENGAMLFIPLNGEWLHDRIQKREIPLVTATVDGKKDHYVLTSSSGQLVGFLEKYRENADAFPRENALVFQRSRTTGPRN